MARRREVATSGDAHRRRSNSLADKPKWRFFKIILPSTLTEKKLRIPIKFVRRFRDELSNVANFIVPNGCNWRVSMRKDQNDIWFDDGWHDFVEHYSIGKGYFLIFAYRGFSSFGVFIFDTTACEIEYTENVGSPVDGESLLVPKCEDFEIITTENLEFRKVSLESKAAIELARQYIPKHPCFMAVLYVYNCRELHVPSKFATRYLSATPKLFKFDVSDGREWTVALRKQRGLFSFGKGMRPFFRDNNLKAGDVCVFEMIKCNEAMKVTIYAVQGDTKIIDTSMSDSTDVSPETCAKTLFEEVS
ncbi:B3 domain-containing transcription factor VRN1-like isoform X2 [Mercurialis annua]|uniref:B3 domain-containing transcription factor VRN1-like isoform X2 n=1 Tax=Mercurialis annua TaxID=3986 RepID=UPI002160B082|nr:B3 domain-containing transcription factor VRN1-like isoform X2 [Mercurialis annua]